MSVEARNTRVWAVGEPLDANDAAFVNPRGSTGNHKSFKKEELMSFICEFPSSAACPMAECTRANPNDELVEGDQTVQTSLVCQATTETFIQTCDSSIEEPTTAETVCDTFSTKPWSERQLTLCCDIAQPKEEKDDDDDSNMGAIIGGVIGAVGAVLLVAGLYWFLKVRPQKGRTPLPPAAPPALNPNMGGGQPAPSGPPLPVQPAAMHAVPIMADGYGEAPPLAPLPGYGEPHPLDPLHPLAPLRPQGSSGPSSFADQGSLAPPPPEYQSLAIAPTDTPPPPYQP